MRPPVYSPPYVPHAPASSSKKGSPDVVFMIALIVWDTLFLAKIYIVLHYIFTRFALGLRVQSKWLCLLAFLFAFGVGPVIAFTSLTTSRSVFLLGIASICCLVFPLLLFPVLIFFWKMCKHVPG
ncbi:hypothetical protein Mapa_007539 [Marchantia paleacea]|nr:hypothetical protein Mapa_007539 [Marchantia paleacea]